MDHHQAHAIRQMPEFIALTSARRKLSVPIVFTIITAYFGFVLLIAFDPQFLGKTIGDSKVSIGIYAGLGLLVLSFALTVIYLRLSQLYIQPLQEQLRIKLAALDNK